MAMTGADLLDASRRADGLATSAVLDQNTDESTNDYRTRPKRRGDASTIRHSGARRNPEGQPPPIKRAQNRHTRAGGKTYAPFALA